MFYLSRIQNQQSQVPRKFFCPNLTLIVTLSDDTLIKSGDAIDTVIPAAEKGEGWKSDKVTHVTRLIVQLKKSSFESKVFSKREVAWIR